MEHVHDVLEGDVSGIQPAKQRHLQVLLCPLVLAQPVAPVE